MIALPPALLQFAYLQLLDLLTTIAFLLHGVAEGNPIVRLVMQQASNPLKGLLALKAAAVLLAVCCWRADRLWLLRWANVFFAVLVAWNLVVLIVAQVASPAMG